MKATLILGLMAAFLGLVSPTRASAQEPLPPDPRLEADNQRYGFTRCPRNEDGSEALQTPAPVATTEHVCGPLACVDNPLSDRGEEGVCGPCQDDGDCGGVRCSPETHRCGPPAQPLACPEGILPTRWLLTAGGTGLWEGPFQGRPSLGVGVGTLFELGLGRSKVERDPLGGCRHGDIPWQYLHLGASVLRSDNPIVSHDLGWVAVTEHPVFTRVGVGAVGHWYGSPGLFNDARYRLGGQAWVELVHNLLLKVGYLACISGPAGDRTGDTFLVTVEYMHKLEEDLIPQR